MFINRFSRRGCAFLGAALACFLAACAGNLTEDEEFERAYAGLERKEAIRDFIAACEGSGHVVVYNGPTYHKLRDPAKHIPSHANLADYSCTTERGMRRGYGVGG